jgi:hypothetical protein
MLSSKTADTLVAEMMMVRAGGWRGPFLVIEGPDDQKFWQARVRLGPEALVISEGAHNLRGCMRGLPPTLAGNVCAIADTDFRAFLATDPFASCTDVFFYDEGFLETFVLNSVALRKLLGTRADPARMRAFLAASGAQSVYVHLRRVASVFGRLRVVNERHAYGASFDQKGFTPYRYVDKTTWLLDIPRLFADFANRTGRTAIDLQAECDSISAIAGLRLVHGHDVLKVLAIGLGQAIGSYNTSPEALLADLCLAFEEESLRRKPLAGRLKAWAGKRALLS